jgi:hypothetical protein
MGVVYEVCKTSWSCSVVEEKLDIIDDNDCDDDGGVSVPVNQWTFALEGVQCR